jgi:hypothetical protein
MRPDRFPNAAAWKEAMMQRRSYPGDRENTSFELPYGKFEDHKPGLSYDKEEKARETRGGDQDDRRFKRSARKDVPKGSLAERVRKASKEG